MPLCRLQGLRLRGASHGMLQPARCRSLLGLVALVRRRLCASLGPTCHSPICTGVRGLRWPCPATPCVQGTAGLGQVVPLGEGKDPPLLAGGLFGAGPLVLSQFAMVEKWGLLGCEAPAAEAYLSSGVLCSVPLQEPPPEAHSHA